MKIHWKKLILCLIIPLAVGGLSAFLTKDGMEIFKTLNKPPLSPPGKLFPFVWTILYIMMGLASYIVLVSKKPNTLGLIAYGVQLFFNFFWSILFFNKQMYLFSFIWLVIMWLLILATTVLFYRNTKLAGYLLIPYLLWVAFAGYLNFGIYLLN
ncbi:MAG: tryptophan-rich sensory protein [Oscillospiraceae bacterium]|nr:tryptophan-rich sensory protein [Oscillospiraceae bacterium]